jgi:energy-coupling factor transporter ATP-binding protein EcfA2
MTENNPIIPDTNNDTGGRLHQFRDAFITWADRLITNNGKWDPLAADVATLSDAPELTTDITLSRIGHIGNALLGATGEFLIARGLWNLSDFSENHPSLLMLPLGLTMVGLNRFLEPRIGGNVRKEAKANYLASTLAIHPMIVDQMRSNSINRDDIPPFHLHPERFNMGINSVNEPPIINKYIRMILEPISYALSSLGNLQPLVSIVSAITAYGSIALGKRMQPQRNKLDNEHVTIRASLTSSTKMGFGKVISYAKDRYFRNMNGYISQEKQTATINAIPMIVAAGHLMTSMTDLGRWPGILNFYLRGHLSRVAENVNFIRDSSYRGVPGEIFKSYANFIRNNNIFFVLDRNWDKWRSTQPEVPFEDEDAPENLVASFNDFHAELDGIKTSLNFKLRRGQITLANFPSGGGKSTSFLAALGLITHQGNLFINSGASMKNLRVLDRGEIKEYISYVSSEFGIDNDSRIIDLYKELHLNEFLTRCEEEGRVPTENEISMFTYQDSNIETQLTLAYNKLLKRGITLGTPENYRIKDDSGNIDPNKNLFGDISVEEFEHLCRLRNDRYDTTQNALASFGKFMEGISPDRTPPSLSRGQLYTAMMSPHLFDDTRLLILDEVFSAIDSDSLPVLLRKVFSVTTERGISLIIVNHGHQAIIEHVANEFSNSNFQMIRNEATEPSDN